MSKKSEEEFSMKDMNKKDKTSEEEFNNNLIKKLNNETTSSKKSIQKPIILISLSLLIILILVVCLVFNKKEDTDSQAFKEDTKPLATESIAEEETEDTKPLIEEEDTKPLIEEETEEELISVNQSELENVSNNELASDSPSTEEESITASEYSIEEMTPVTMYATKACNVRSGPATTYDKVGSLAYGQAVTVEGKVVYNDKTWFKLSAQSDTSPEIEMVSSSLLSQTKPSTQSKSTSSSTSSTPSTPSTPSAPVVQQPAASIPGYDAGEAFESTPTGIGDGNGAGGQGFTAE